MDRIARIMEFFWLACGCASAVWVGYLMATEGWQARKLFIWFPLVCFAMFFYRRFMRKKMTEWAERKANEERREGK